MVEVQLGEGAMFGGVGFGYTTRRPRTDSRSTGTLLRFGSAVRFELGHWRWFMLLEVAGVLRSLSRRGRQQGWLGILVMCGQRSWFWSGLCAAVRVRQSRSFRLCRCFALAGEVGVVDEGCVNGAGARGSRLVTILLGGGCGRMVPF